MGRAASRSSPPVLEIFAFDPKNASLSASPVVRFLSLFAALSDRLCRGEVVRVLPLLVFMQGVCVIDGNPLGVAVHPSGDELVCSTANGCK